MKAPLRETLSLLLTGWMALAAGVRQQSEKPTSASIPNFISYSSVLTDEGGEPIRGITGITFLLYREKEGGPPLWIETQNVTTDRSGHYSVQLGITSAQGLPPDLFLTGEARWLAVQVAGQAEQPRVLLVAVPYAMKAGDAQTVGGFPASAFARAVSPNGVLSNLAPENASECVSPAGNDRKR